MELVVGKELFEKIIDKGNYSEKDAANVVRQIVDAVAYLHCAFACRVVSCRVASVPEEER
jgi:calcium/calmodulin-dependent protein kinase I